MGVESYNKEQMERLRGHKVAFDREVMWAAIQKKKKRRGLIFFFTMALVALAIVFLSWIMYSRWSTPIIGAPAMDASSTESIETALPPSTSEVTDPSMLVVGDLEEVSGSVPSDEGYQVINAEQDSSDIKSAHAAHGPLRMRGQAATSSSKEDNHDASPQGQTEGYLKEEINVTDLASVIPDGDKVDGRDTEHKDEQVDIDTGKAVQRFDNIGLLPYKWPFLESIAPRTSYLGDLQIVMLPHKIIPYKPRNWSLGVYGGYGLPSRTLVEVIEGREATPLELGDEVLEEVSIGVDLRYAINARLYLASGLEYWHVTDRRSSSTSSVSNLDDLDRESLGFEEGQTGIVIVTTREVKHTMYRTISAPALLGYEYPIGGVRVFAEGGALFNNYTSTRGELPSLSEVTSVDYEVGSQLQVVPVANVGASMSLNDRLGWYVRVGWRGEHEVTTARSQVRQSYSTIRSQVGIRFRL